MQNNLVTCFIKETFDNKCKNILLGDWCKPPTQNQDLFKNSETIEYHLNDHIKLENGHRYLNNLFFLCP